MRPLVVIASLLLALPIEAATVRVRSRHDEAKLAAGGMAYRIEPHDSLKGSVIGPGLVRIGLRRMGSGDPITVRLVRDGREVSKTRVSGKLREKLIGDRALVSPKVDRSIDLPPGPHTVFVEVGPGEGFVLVSFEEEQESDLDLAPVALVPKANDKPGAPQVRTGPLPALPTTPRSAPAEEDPDAPAPLTSPTPTAPPPPAAPAGLATGPTPPFAPAASKPAAPARPAPVARAEPAAPPAVAPAPAALPAMRPARPDALAGAQTSASRASPSPGDGSFVDPTGRAARSGEAARPGPATADASDLESGSVPSAEAPAAEVSAASDADRSPRLALGARLGTATQTQLGLTGPAAGFSIRFLAKRAGPGWIALGVTGDVLAYQLDLTVSRSRYTTPLKERRTYLSIPLLAEGTFITDPLGASGLRFSAGAGVGVALASLHRSQLRVVNGTPVDTAADETASPFAAEGHLGIELPVGRQLVGVEARLLASRTGEDGSSRDFELGGALLQASWRFGL